MNVKYYCTQAIGAASVVVFRSITGKLRPSPSQPHYLFTMHDILHVYEGLLLMSPETKAQAQPQFSLLNRRGFLSSTLSGRRTKTARKAKTMGKLKSGRKEKSSLPSLRGSEMRKPKIRGQSLPGDADQLEMTTTVRMLLRLWSHENTRVYVDRLVDSRDRIWFQKLLETCMKYCFCGLDLQGGETTPQPLMGHSAARGKYMMSEGCIDYTCTMMCGEMALRLKRHFTGEYVILFTSDNCATVIKYTQSPLAHDISFHRQKNQVSWWQNEKQHPTTI